MSDENDDWEEFLKDAPRVDEADFNSILLTLEASSSIFDSDIVESIKFPKLIYHYTDLMSLFSIFSSKEIWASDVQYMNDRSEVRHFFNLALNYCGEQAKRSESHRRDVWIVLYNLLSQNWPGASVCAACFCSTPDNLDHWRSYGGFRQPVSIGVNLELLSTPERAHEVEGREPITVIGNEVRKIIYSSAAQKRFIEKIVKQWYECAYKHCKSNKWEFTHGFLSMFNMWLVGELMKYAACFKNRHFRTEKEVRVFRTYGTWFSMSQPSFRSNGTFIIPYIPISLIRGEKFAIEEIWIGPSEEQSAVARSVQFWLFRGGLHEQVSVKLSEIPLRQFITQR